MKYKKGDLLLETTQRHKADGELRTVNTYGLVTSASKHSSYYDITWLIDGVSRNQLEYGDIDHRENVKLLSRPKN